MRTSRAMAVLAKTAGLRLRMVASFLDLCESNGLRKEEFGGGGLQLVIVLAYKR